MPKFSSKSLTKLESCHEDLQKLFHEVITKFDCTIIEGHRSNERQNELFKSSKSKLKGGFSKHNKTPSLAIDVAPYHTRTPHIDWNKIENFHLFAGYVLATADKLDINIRWGGSWDQTLDTRNNKFNDLVHFELV